MRKFKEFQTMRMSEEFQTVVEVELVIMGVVVVRMVVLRSVKLNRLGPIEMTPI